MAGSMCVIVVTFNVCSVKVLITITYQKSIKIYVLIHAGYNKVSYILPNKLSIEM